MNIQKDEKSRSPYTYVVILVALILLNVLLARFGVIARPIGLGCSGLYFSVAFMIAFALWFGAWGVIAAYVGCFRHIHRLAYRQSDCNNRDYAIAPYIHHATHSKGRSVR